MGAVRARDATAAGLSLIEFLGGLQVPASGVRGVAKQGLRLPLTTEDPPYILEEPDETDGKLTRAGHLIALTRAAMKATLPEIHRTEEKRRRRQHRIVQTTDGLDPA